MSEITPHNPLEGERPELTLDLNDGSEEHISIVIVHKDRPEYLNICLQSIAVTSFNNNYEIIVVDNNSGKESQEFLDDIEDEVTVIRNKENLYWGPAANKGFKEISESSKYVVFMHCDVVITNPAWLDLLVNVSESQNAGLVGTELQSYYMQNQKVDFIQEWLVLVTKECFEACGPFEESVPQVGCPFILTMQCQRKGFNPQVMRNPIAHHYRIFSLDINDYERLTEQATVTLPKVIQDIQSESV